MSRLHRLYFILVFSFIIFLAELIISIRTGSVALKADAFHVLSDVIATCITIYSIKLVSRDKTPHATYGWLRSEILGGLGNSVFLLALAFNILIEAIEKIIDIDEIKDKLEDGIDEVFIIGWVGLAINLIALFVVHGSHDHESKELKSYISVSSITNSIELSEELDNRVMIVNRLGSETNNNKKKKKRNVNTRGLILHIIGDILGSVVVIISSTTIKYASGDFKYYLDPIVSLFTVMLITFVTIPLIFKCCRILLHHVSKKINMVKLKDELNQIRYVKEIHELHIWQLDDHKLVGSLHYNINSKIIEDKDIPNVIQETITKIKTIFHKYGIHSTTIQPEYHLINMDDKGFEDVDITDRLKDIKTNEIRINIKPGCIDIKCCDNCFDYKCCK